MPDTDDMPAGFIRASRPRPAYRPLLSPSGSFDRPALYAWFGDGSAWKSRMSGDDLLPLGINDGDLLITDPQADLDVGDVAVVVDEEMMTSHVGIVAMGENGCRYVRSQQWRFPLDEEPYLVILLCGSIPLEPGADATLADLDRARLLPLF